MQNQAVSPSTLLLREACYRAVGEGFAHVSQHIDFTTWYASELQGLLEKGLAVRDLCCCQVTCHEVVLISCHEMTFRVQLKFMPLYLVYTKS